MEINQIARINLGQIFKDWQDEASVVFSEEDFDFRKDIITVCANGSAEDYFEYLESSGALSPENINPERVVSYQVWGLRLGLRDIPMLKGNKTMYELIAEEEKKDCWIMNQNHFSHLIEERVVAENNGYPISEFTVYKISEIQWRTVINKATGFAIFKEEINN